MFAHFFLAIGLPFDGCAGDGDFDAVVVGLGGDLVVRGRHLRWSRGGQLRWLGSFFDQFEQVWQQGVGG